MASAFYPIVSFLLAVSAAILVTTTTTAKTISGVQQDPNQGAKISFNLTQVGAGTVDARVEGSWDNSNWITLASMTQLAAAGARAQLVDPTCIAPYMRVVVTLGSTATVATGARIGIVSTSGIKSADV